MESTTNKEIITRSEIENNILEAMELDGNNLIV